MISPADLDTISNSFPVASAMNRAGPSFYGLKMVVDALIAANVPSHLINQYEVFFKLDRTINNQYVRSTVLRIIGSPVTANIRYVVTGREPMNGEPSLETLQGNSAVVAALKAADVYEYDLIALWIASYVAAKAINQNYDDDDINEISLVVTLGQVVSPPLTIVTPCYGQTCPARSSLKRP